MDDRRLREIEDQAKGDCCIVSDPYAFDLIAEIRRLRIELKTRTTERDDARGLVDDALAGMEELDPHHIAVQHNRVRIARDWGG